MVVYGIQYGPDACIQHKEDACLRKHYDYEGIVLNFAIELLLGLVVDCIFYFVLIYNQDMAPTL